MATSDGDRTALLARLFGDASVPEALTAELIHTRDVARVFQVSERTVAEWARRGRIPSVRTPGGHRMYPAARIREILSASHGIAVPVDAESLATGHGPVGSSSVSINDPARA